VLYVTGYAKESFVKRGIASLGNALHTSLLAHRVCEVLNGPSSIQPYAGSGVQTWCDQVSDIEPDLNHLGQNDQQTRRDLRWRADIPGSPAMVAR
jgi:hypothetical protein